MSQEVLFMLFLKNLNFSLGEKNMSNRVAFSTLEGTQYIGNKNDFDISKNNSHLNSIFAIDVAQSSYFTMLIEGFEYGRFYTSHMSVTTSPNDGRRDTYYERSSQAFSHTTAPRKSFSTGFEDQYTLPDGSVVKARNGSIYWMPLKSLSYNQGSIETANISVGAFADLHLPFRKHSPTLSVEMYDARNDFFEMKLREWHNMSVLTEGFVPVLESICKKVQIRSWATNGECNSLTECQCILADDINVTRSYDGNDLKLIQFKLIVVGWGGGK